MQLRCYRCGWSFAIKKDEIVFALEALEESGGNHYDVRCPRCRHMNRVSIEQLRKAAPRPETEETEASSPAQTEDEQGDRDSGEPQPEDQSSSHPGESVES
jgi:phage FluMu protein Com